MSSAAIYLKDYLNVGFSNCSINAINIEKAKPGTCLRVAPDKPTTGAVCGDQITSGGEECDCGSEADCIRLGRNTICDFATCKLFPGAECDSGECCDHNGMFKSGEICQYGDGYCLENIRCTGQSSKCPSKVSYKPLGSSCDNYNGYCVDGSCRTREGECKHLWGPSSKLADEKCNSHNTKGNHKGNCGSYKNGGVSNYIPCLEKDKECGKLYCTIKSVPSGRPYYGLMIDGECGIAVGTNNDFSRYGSVRNFVPCGRTGLDVCFGHICYDVFEAIRLNYNRNVVGGKLGNHTNECTGQNERIEGGICYTTRNESKTKILVIAISTAIGIIGLFLSTLVFVMKRYKSPFKGNWKINI